VSREENGTGDGGADAREGGAQTDGASGGGRRFGAPLQLAGVWAVAGAVIGAVAGLVADEITLGALIGFAVGAVIGTLRDSRRIFRR
jgi:hypothetical protein